VTTEFSIALAGEHHDRLSTHLTRDDGQEDVCFALWRPSTGGDRATAIITEAILPEPDERKVDRTAWFTGEYALRAARRAAAAGAGVALLHSHPGAISWQSAPDGSADAESERKIANLVREITGHALVGLTLSTASQIWSGRKWDQGRGTSVSHVGATSARVLGDVLRVGYHPILRPEPTFQDTQVRTLHSWGEQVQSNLARLRVLVVGAGSVGQVVLEMLARTGVEHIGVMDFDTVEVLNLDRLHSATKLDAGLQMSKAELGGRVMNSAATASPFTPAIYEMSVCEHDGMQAALDFDVIFCCVDRPWPRHVLNTIAYADVIPVIDGGIRLEPGGCGGLRNAYWRSHVAGPGRTCIRCLRQYDVADVQLERDGSLDDPSYIANLPQDSPLRARQNVYAASLAAASALTNQFLSLVVAPSDFGDPGPLRFDLRQHRIERIDAACTARCSYLSQQGTGDARSDPTGVHTTAQAAIAHRLEAQCNRRVRLARAFLNLTERFQRGITRVVGLPKTESTSVASEQE
jgi:hypothetical protein